MFIFLLQLDLPATFQLSSVSNVNETKVFMEDESNKHNGAKFSLAQTTDINASHKSTDDKDKEIYCYDTIDVLPHIDHYRNLFSITSPEPRSRPTLEALHGTSVFQNEPVVPARCGGV